MSSANDHISVAVDGDPAQDQSVSILNNGFAFYSFTIY